MSKLEVDKLTPQSGTSLTVGDVGDTVVFSDATVTLPAVQSVATELKTNKISPASGTAFTFGDSGDTFTIPSGVTIANNGTQTGFGGTNTPNFRVTLSSNQSISDETNTKVAFDTEDYDSNNAFASNKFTVPSGQAGLYFLSSKVVFDWTSSGRILEFRSFIYKNGSSISEQKTNYETGSGAQGGKDQTAQLTGVYNLAVSDYIEIYAYVDYGGSVTIQSGATMTEFCGFKLVT